MNFNLSALSAAASFLNELSQLRQQNPRQFSQVVTRITDRLNRAAQNATNSGASQMAAQLSQLAASLQNAASNGQVSTTSA